MNVTTPNQYSRGIIPSSINLYDNGHLSSDIKSNTAPVAYSSFQTFTDAAFFKLEFSEFNNHFKFDITSIEGGLDSNEVVLYLNLEKKLSIKAILEGFWKQDTEPTFQLKSFGMKLDEKQETPISIFLSSTLWAMLGLSSKFKVHIPQLNYNLTTSFELSIDEVSKLLQERQIAYRLLVIEFATGVKLPFPQGYPQGDDIESIAFCYHAIVDRQFDWFAIPRTIPWIANEETLSWLPKTTKPTSVTFRPEPVIKFIFGVEIPLGILNGRIDNAVIDNYEEVKEKLSRFDNAIVNVNQRSVDGVIKMFAVDVPQLPPNPWTKELQKLIDLENKLDKKVLDKYFKLASSTLESLTEKQKERITERPDLDIEAFSF
jgi:hypothetical protein